MNRITQIFLSSLVILVIALNIFGMFDGGEAYFWIVRLLLMPAIVILTFLVLSGAQDRSRKKRFPGNREKRDKASGNDS